MLRHEEIAEKGSEKMREREAFLDRLRVMATLAVVMLHTATGVMDATDMSLYPEENRVFLTVMDLVCWCVPVFLVISGYLFLNPCREMGLGRMLTKYCRRIVLALILFGVPYGCLELLAAEGRFRLGMPGEAFVKVLRGQSRSHMWYLYLILLLYAVTPLLKRVLKAVPRWAVGAAALVLLMGCSLLPYLWELRGAEGPALPGDGIYFFYYICGYLFATAERGRLERAVGKGILPGLILLLCAGMAASRLWGNYALQMAYNYPFTVLLALLLFAWGMGTEERRGAGRGHGTGHFREQAAALSFTVYLIHPVFLNMAYKFFRVTPLSGAALLPLPAALSLGTFLLLFFGGTALLSAAFAWVLYRIPPLRKYVL